MSQHLTSEVLDYNLDITSISCAFATKPDEKFVLRRKPRTQGDACAITTRTLACGRRYSPYWRISLAESENTVIWDRNLFVRNGLKREFDHVIECLFSLAGRHFLSCYQMIAYR